MKLFMLYIFLFSFKVMADEPLISTNFVCESKPFKIEGMIRDSVMEKTIFWYDGMEYPVKVIDMEIGTTIEMELMAFDREYRVVINGIVHPLKDGEYPENFPDHSRINWISSSMLSIGDHMEKRIYNMPCVGDDFRGNIVHR